MRGILVPRQEIEPKPLHGEQSLNHWTPREVQFFFLCSFSKASSPSPHTRQTHSGPSVRELRSILTPTDGPRADSIQSVHFLFQPEDPGREPTLSSCRFSSSPRQTSHTGVGSMVGRAGVRGGGWARRVLTGHLCTSQYAFSWQSSAYLSTLFRSFPALKSHKPRWKPGRCCMLCSLMAPLPDGPYSGPLSRSAQISFTCHNNNEDDEGSEP